MPTVRRRVRRRRCAVPTVRTRVRVSAVRRGATRRRGVGRVRVSTGGGGRRLIYAIARQLGFSFWVRLLVGRCG